MKKLWMTIGVIAMMMLAAGCQADTQPDVTEGQQPTPSPVVDGQDISDNQDDLTEEPDEVLPVTMNQAIEWSKTLLAEKALTADLNQDGKDDSVAVSYVEKEGSQYIETFELKLDGKEGSFVLEDYDAAFVNLEYFDFNGDGSSEVILLFDTRGGGGQGTHDMYVIYAGEDGKLASQKMAPNVDGVADMDASWSLDGVYSIEKVRYNGSERILARQYISGAEGHSDSKGDMISILAWKLGDSTFTTESSWVE